MMMIMMMGSEEGTEGMEGVGGGKNGNDSVIGFTCLVWLISRIV